MVMSSCRGLHSLELATRRSWKQVETAACQGSAWRRGRRHCRCTASQSGQRINHKAHTWSCGQCLLPVPCPCFIEHDAAGHNDLVSVRIIKAICLAPALVPKQNKALATVLELAQVRPCVLGVRDTPKYAKVIDIGLSATPIFDWCLPLDAPGVGTFEHEDSGGHRLAGSPQNRAGTPMAFSIQRAVPTTV
jgi:hypothetical protein